MRLKLLNGSQIYDKNAWGSSFQIDNHTFSKSYWRDLHFTLYSRFSLFFVNSEYDACIYFGPRTWLRRYTCEAIPNCENNKLIIYVEEATDADHKPYRICSNAWSVPCDRRLIRITGGIPGRFIKNVALSSCASIEVPWLAHLRQPNAWSKTNARKNKICMAAGLRGHYVSNILGFTTWRINLHKECNKRSKCHISATNPIENVLKFYSQCDMCLQPPGDMLVRPGIIDAMSVGCVPVLLHPKQSAYWPLFWNAKNVSIIFDMRHINASTVLNILENTSKKRIVDLKNDGKKVIPYLTYSFNSSGDAFSHLVSVLSTYIEKNGHHVLSYTPMNEKS